MAAPLLGLTGGGLPLALFLTGLASGVHCVGMCGGIVSAFAARRSTRDEYPVVRLIPVPAGPGATAMAVPVQGMSDAGPLPRLLAFNAGRIASYCAAGTAAGAVGSVGAYASGMLPLQAVFYVMANLVLMAAGLYVAGALRGLTRLEVIGAPLWRRLAPLAAGLNPAASLPRAVAAGAVWGWLPCGLVYAALMTAVFAGSPAAGALAMLAFGLGTLPSLLAAGLAAAQIRRLFGRRTVRIAVGSLICGFGLLGLARAADVSGAIAAGLLCL